MAEYAVNGQPAGLQDTTESANGYPNFATRALHLRDATYCCSLGQFVHVEQTGRKSTKVQPDYAC